MLTADGAQVPQFLFFARHYNDIDHTVPVIWGLLRQGVSPERIRYVAYEADPSIEPKRDKRLEFLARKGVVLETPYLEGGLRSFFHWFTAAPVGSLVRRKARKVLFRKLVQKADALSHGMQAIESAPEGSIVVADHSLSQGTKDLMLAARKRNLTTVSIPHGFQFHFGFTVPATERALSPKTHIDPLVRHFDHVIAGDTWQKDLLDTGAESDGKLHVLGLPRFDPEWVQKLCFLHPASDREERKLKILFILEKGALTIGGTDVEWLNIEEQFRALEFLATHPGIQLRVKGNARGVSYRQSKMLRAYKRYLAEDAIPSHQLISWADLSVGCCSSVFMDAYVRNKPVVILEYATYLKMAFRNFGFDNNPTSHEQFVSMINKLVECRKENLYDEKSLQQLIEYYVYGGRKGKSVVDTYADFLQSLIN